MTNLSTNEMNQVSGGTTSINACYKYIDCFYTADGVTLLTSGSSSLCPANSTKPDDGKAAGKFKQLDTYLEREVLGITYLVNICIK